jgi:hypothetical protein
MPYALQTDLDKARQGGRTITVSQTVPAVQETVTVVRPTRETRTSDVGVDPSSWSWEQVRDYTVRQIESFHGEFPKQPERINSIFKSFCSRHGADAGPIAVAAFALYQGRWKGSPISVTRFCKGSDDYFALPIKERLTAS